MLSSVLGMGLMASLALARPQQDPNLPVDPSLIACGNAFYTPDQYTCYDGYNLCPIQYGVATLPCGPDCYDPNVYSCIDSSLAPPAPSMESNFLLVAFQYEYSDAIFVQAQGLIFTVNNGGPSTYCPDSVAQVSVCPAGVNTVFVCTNGSCSLNVEVPGGQQIYVAPNGALSYTQAHSGAIPDGSQTSGFSVDNGQLTFNSYGFVTCTSADGTSSQVFVNYPSTISTCSTIQLATAAGNQPGFGAWQYT